MNNLRKPYRLIVLITIITGIVLLSSCSVDDDSVDPGAWGYDTNVTYDALGGIINSREVRDTYYMNNSYLFKPSGATNMLIEPIKDGYLLAGWYTEKEDIKDAEGNIIGYSFKQEDRWDFFEDRVQEDMTLYARWIPQGHIDYVDADTDQVLFSKNITEASPVQKLSGAAELLVSKSGHALAGYFEDKESTIPYDFQEYIHQDLIPTNEEVYASLYEEFPQYFKRVAYVEPEEPSDNEDSITEIDSSDLFINRLGYEITTDDELALAQIRAYKDRIYEDAINHYVENSSKKIIYMKYIEGNYIQVKEPYNLLQGDKYCLSGLDVQGNPLDGYIISEDIDLSGLTFEMAESFSGEILGNGNSLNNITINVSSRRIEIEDSRSAGLFGLLDGAYIENLTFENLNIGVDVASGTPVSIGALAIQANNTELKNVHFGNLTIDTGRGDDGSAVYKVGDLFTSHSNTKLDNVTGNDINISASASAQINSILTE